MSAKEKKTQQIKKTGKQFEEIIGWIQQSVHNRAEIAVNQKLRDKDTGKPRQIDITIRMCDGPTRFLGIIEVRDRSRPMGVGYVEKISAKRCSVKADAAFLVSNSGFYRTAIIKAKELNIRTLTYEEAKSVDWSDWLQCRTFSVLYPKYDKPTICFFEYGTDSYINVSAECIASVRENSASKIILDEQGTTLVSIPDFFNKVINIFGRKPYEDIPTDGTRIKRLLIFQGKFNPPLWIEAGDRKSHQIGEVRIEAELYLERNEYPITLKRYRETNSIKSIAELATADVDILGKKYRIEMLAPGVGDYVPAGTTIYMRSIPLGNSSNDKK